MTPANKNIFVFGSNLAGRHGAGSAMAAMNKHGAIRGQGLGLQGNSYAIATKGHALETLPLETIERHVRRFLVFAGNHPDLRFNIVAIGCGLAGFRPEQIAPMFKDAPDNCQLPHEFLKVLNRSVA